VSLLFPFYSDSPKARFERLLLATSAAGQLLTVLDRFKQKWRTI
jgi:hypothetical protein